ncbi:MAG: hypothetical protein U0531_18490 [Dehalococcoidia bacterium]
MIPVLCAYTVGGCQAVFDMSVRYSQTRVQFGVPIYAAASSGCKTTSSGSSTIWTRRAG